MDTALITTSYLPSIGYSLLATLITTLVISYYYVETNRTVRLSLKLPNPPRVPILGHALITLNLNPEDALTTVLEYANKYGPVLSAHLGLRAFVFLSDPQDVEIILRSHVNIEKSVEYRLFEPWTGDGLLITKGTKWREHRKMIVPTFHTGILKMFIHLFYENSLDLVRRLRNKANQQFDCHDYISAATVDILTKTVMGVRKEMRQNTGHDYAMAVMKLSEILHRRHYDITLRVDQLFRFSNLAKLQQKLLHTIHLVSKNIIQEKLKDIENKEKNRTKDDQVERKISENIENEKSTTANYTKLHYARDDLDDIDENDVGEKKRLAFLDMLMDMKKNGGQMTDEDIWEEVNSIMFASVAKLYSHEYNVNANRRKETDNKKILQGHDTAAAGSSFVLCVLGSLPEIQARVYEELKAIFGDSDRQCTFQDTNEMKYLERVILETLRLFPPVPGIARRLSEDVRIKTGNYLLPKNITVAISLFIIHRMEKYYPNPLVFNPDNFLPEKMQQRHHCSFIPFSTGPRSCVGQKYAMLKMKVLLSTLLRNYLITSDVSYQDFILRADITLKRGDGFNIKIEPRKSIS